MNATMQARSNERAEHSTSESGQRSRTSSARREESVAWIFGMYLSGLASIVLVLVVGMMGR